MPAFPPAFSFFFWNRGIPLAPGFATTLPWTLCGAGKREQNAKNQDKEIFFHKTMFVKLTDKEPGYFTDA